MDGRRTLTNVFTFLSYLTALLYCSSSYTKDSAPLYLMFTGSNAITCYMCLATSLRGSAATPASVALGIAQALMFAIFCIFSIAKNLGKRKSLSMAALLVACSIVCLVLMLPMETKVLLNAIGGVLLMVAFLLMTYAKYKDKEARGTN